MFLLLLFSLLLLCSFFRLKELFQVKNGLTTSLLFFFLMPKIWVGRTTLKGEKKRGWPQLLERNHNDCGTQRCQQFRHAGQTNCVSGQKTPATLLASPQKYDEAFIHLGMNISNERSTHPDLQNLSLVGQQDNRGKAPQNKEVSYFWLVYM